MRRKDWFVWGLRKAVVSQSHGVRDDMPPEELTVQRNLGLHFLLFQQPSPWGGVCEHIRAGGLLITHHHQSAYPKSSHLLRLGPAVIWPWVCLLPPVR